ncbi:hypothetical protein QBC34DRAFT_442497 [Podospora aff. communis PSN243]|uniref:DUF1996 domain-containing protein n=1 Tax=Podospora aff. communis PSN243 TaxID=3040156 RepID=A0AAV9G985_9PEZI|nr:hypothetical protein QBC34DRAFT_442497 [Podospora aff. communis PSN243]
MAWAIAAVVALFARDVLAAPQPQGGRGGGGGAGGGMSASQRGSDFLRFGCSQLVIERTDPIVNPGVVFSPHLHQIVGGNSFNVTMDPASMDPAKSSKCTSCKMVEDFSNYWTASIYFQSPENGTFRRVPQMANGRLNGTLLEQDGGLTVYYMRPFSGSNKKTTVFSKGFRMISGDPSYRTKPAGPLYNCHRCLSKSERIMGGNGAPCDRSDTSEFPNKPCPGGIRTTIIFPSCWDGKNVDSPDHRSHVAYSGTSNLAGDKCPASHPVRIPQVMYEIMYDTSEFANPEYYKNGKQPLVYSFGDRTGHGNHGDYLFGWEDGALQRAMDALGTNCWSETCPALKLQAGETAIACTKTQQAREDVSSKIWVKELPGNPELS